MPVIIENITPDDRPDDQPHEYRLRVNAKLITNFLHVRDRGLAECLRAAADAVDRHKVVVSERGGPTLSTTGRGSE